MKKAVIILAIVLFANNVVFAQTDSLKSCAHNLVQIKHEIDILENLTTVFENVVCFPISSEEMYDNFMSEMFKRNDIKTKCNEDGTYQIYFSEKDTFTRNVVYFITYNIYIKNGRFKIVGSLTSSLKNADKTYSSSWKEAKSEYKAAQIYAHNILQANILAYSVLLMNTKQKIANFDF